MANIWNTLPQRDKAEATAAGKLAAEAGMEFKGEVDISSFGNGVGSPTVGQAMGVNHQQIGFSGH